MTNVLHARTRRLDPRWLWSLSLIVLAAGCEDESPCDPGTLGCACLADQSCRESEAACIEGICLPPREQCSEGACRPRHPQCFTPCSGPLTAADGTTRSCSDEGLMEGCVAGMTCRQGSCTPEDEAGSSSVAADAGVLVAADIGSCQLETDCPDFQTCIDGRCYSDCTQDADCGSAQLCRRKVCRDACIEQDRCSEASQSCSDGVCLPTVPSTSAVAATATGGFSVDVDILQFSSHATEGAITITNETESSQLFTVRKSEETLAGADGERRILRASEGDEPLPWLELGTRTPTRTPEVRVVIPARQARTVLVANAKGSGDEARSVWTGALEIAHSTLGTRRVLLGYSDTLDGRWLGEVHYFGNFEDGRRGEHDPLSAWIEDRNDLTKLDAVPNALLQAWGRFRNGLFPLEQMQALVTSTLRGTWQSARTRELCQAAGYGDGAVCAPFGGSGSQNVLLYSSAGNVNPVPSGAVQLDFAIDIRAAVDNDSEACERGSAALEDCFVGTILSDVALQYGGDPRVTLGVAGGAASCAMQEGTSCLAHVTALSAEVSVGARYVPRDDDAACAAVPNMELHAVPWLVPGFTPAGVLPGVEGEAPTRRECRDTAVPFADTARNIAYAGANPVPDGRARRRVLSLVDGLVIDQRTMVLLLREQITSFVDGSAAPDASYAYAVLQKQPDDGVVAEAGSAPLEPSSTGEDLLGVACSGELVGEVTGRPSNGALDRLAMTELQALARAVVRGDTSAVGDVPDTTDQTGESVHYLCRWSEDAVDRATVWRAVFDAGPDGNTPCPADATVAYFALDDDIYGAGFEPADDACNATAPEDCATTLESWARTRGGMRLRAQDEQIFAWDEVPQGVRFDLITRCDDGAAGCDGNLFDLREGKTFLAADQPEVFFPPLEAEIFEAFRFRSQFVSERGKTLGFAPQICQGGSELVPYCYAPAAITRVLQRVDCALDIYTSGRLQRDDQLPQDQRRDTLDTLRLFLLQSLGAGQSFDALGQPVVTFGFERQNAELLLLLGDEALTRAFASRFDLAESNVLAFAGEQFEPGGVPLSGAAGYEMYLLYQATQYYGMALDRFYTLGPTLWRSLAGTAADGVTPIQPIIDQQTVSVYLDRIVRASTQTAAAFEEIARRYQALNRPDLAREVIRRAYTRAYQESQLLARFITGIQQQVNASAVPQVVQELEEAQRRYRMAMLDMADMNGRIRDGVTFFGLAPDYIPFPALDEGDVNGFEVMFTRARQAAEVAEAAEQAALQSARDLDVDEAEFQSELVTIRNQYEAQLGELCGTFTGSDGRVHPALPRYSHLDPKLARLNDPCGAPGNGQIWSKLADLRMRELEQQRMRQVLSNLEQQAGGATGWVATQCKIIQDDVSRFLEAQSAIDDWQSSIDDLGVAVSGIDRSYELLKEITRRFTAETTELAGAGDAGSILREAAWAANRGVNMGYYIGGTVLQATAVTLESVIASKQAKIRERERQYEAANIGRQCEVLQAELAYTLRAIQREISLAEIDALSSAWNIQAELSQLQHLVNERERLEAQWQDSEQLTVNTAAAKNDPNVRIYKNSAILDADRTFQRAMQAAYRATRIYEYYTSTSYAAYEKLFLIRMVGSGDLHLNMYLDELEDRFHEFEDQYGNPDTRLAQVSMRDDVFKVPRYATDGSNRILSAEERVQLFRRHLQDPARRNDDGYLSLGFSTDFAQLSPLTANHKILSIEVGIEGEGLGDAVGRFYLRQVGTGVLGAIDGERQYYTFPERTGVMNPVFNGDRSIAQGSAESLSGPTSSIFRSYRFRERPFVQTNWELQLNQRTESVNQDIDLNGIDDIKLFIYYTDFTP